jgi:hypothetical protein
VRTPSPTLPSRSKAACDAELSGQQRQLPHNVTGQTFVHSSTPQLRDLYVVGGHECNVAAFAAARGRALPHARLNFAAASRNHLDREGGRAKKYRTATWGCAVGDQSRRRPLRPRGETDPPSVETLHSESAISAKRTFSQGPFDGHQIRNQPIVCLVFIDVAWCVCGAHSTVGIMSLTN